MRSVLSPTDTLHKPKYGPPWEAESVVQLLANGTVRDIWWVGSIDSDGEFDEMGFIAELPGFLPDEAAAVADLWGWIERAERYENALARIAFGFLPDGQTAAEAARDILRGEGRL